MAKFVSPFLLLFFLGSSSSVAEESCGGVLTNVLGVITSPNYPNNYPNNITCSWKISPEKSHVNLTIEDLMIEDSDPCIKFDYIKLRAKVGYTTDEVALCGSITSRQLSLKVEGAAVEITFKTDHTFTGRGFKISYIAYDVDPCLEKNGGCSHICNLVKGARVCSCRKGYGLKYDKTTCLGENSCYFIGHKKCPSRNRITCRDLPDNTTTCVCWRGYKKQHGKCVDIDECKEKPNNCGVGKCRNGRGWFTCDCPKGYYFDGVTCVDRNECNYEDCGDATCMNTPGGFTCQCDPGYQFNDDLLVCQDVNECTATNNTCDHMCTNTEGSYICSCRSGYFLDSDGKSCRAVRVEGLGRVHASHTCQDKSLDISCTNDQEALIIHKATYGRGYPGVSLCPYKQEHALSENDTDDSSLCEKDVTDKIKDLCGWRKKCNITVNSQALGAACPGVYKYLTVLYSCGKPLMCQSLLPLRCPAAEKDDCISDESCHSSQMCCFNGCKRVCAVPSLYLAET